MTKVILMVVDDDPTALQLTEQLLRNRYSVNYEVVCEHSPVVALRRLEAWHVSGDEVAVLLADHWMPEMTGTEFLARTHRLYPHAKRALLIDRIDPTVADPLHRAMALGQIDYYAVKPASEPDEAFHQIITDFLAEWTGAHQATFEIVQVVGEWWDPRSHEFRDLLERNGIPYGFYDVNSEEGQALVQRVQRPAGPFPVVILFDGTSFADPSVEEVADVLGAAARPPQGVYDLAIIGGGPAGISAAVYGASEGLRTIVVEREAIGGQAGTSSRIRNYLGFPKGVSGTELAGRAYTQAMLFGANFYLIREARELRTNENQHVVTLSDGTEVVSRTVVLAMGVTYRRLGVASLEALTGAGVFYGAAMTEARAMQGQDVFVVGGGNSAGQAAVYLAKYAARVTMVVRGESLAASMSDYLIKEIHDRHNIIIRLNTQVVDGWGDYRLKGIVLEDTHSGTIEEASAAGLFILIGAQPRTDWLPPAIERAAQGYIITGRDLTQDERLLHEWTLRRAPFLLETSVPGVFAVGDVRHRSIKRVASAVGEGSIAVQFIHEYLAAL